LTARTIIWKLELMISIGTDCESSKRAISSPEKFAPCVYEVAGLATFRRESAAMMTSVTRCDQLATPSESVRD